LTPSSTRSRLGQAIAGGARDGIYINGETSLAITYVIKYGGSSRKIV